MSYKQRPRLQRVDVPPNVVELAFRRTEFALYGVYRFNHTLREALANAWLQGLYDMQDAMESKAP